MRGLRGLAGRPCAGPGAVRRAGRRLGDRVRLGGEAGPVSKSKLVVVVGGRLTYWLL